MFMGGSVPAKKGGECSWGGMVMGGGVFLHPRGLYTDFTNETPGCGLYTGAGNTPNSKT